MELSTFPLTAESGTLFRRVFRMRNKATGEILNPVGYSVIFQLKDKVESATALLTASTANGKITFSGNDVVISIPAGEFTIPSRQLPYWMGIKVTSASGVVYKTVIRQMVISHKFIV